MTKILVFLLVLTLSASVYAQQRVLDIPPKKSADAVFLDAYRLIEPNPAKDKYGIESMRRFGWLEPSSKFDTDSFYQWTKQKCIEKVGKDFFYQRFKLSWQSFKNDPASEVYTITYLIAPFQDSLLEDDIYIKISFKRYDFLGRSETEIPSNLPDCINNPILCTFYYDREKVLAIAREKVIGTQQVLNKGPYLTLLPDFNWQVSVELAGAGIKTFTVDSRTGAMSEVRTSWRID